ncbi:hypothetical protein CEXT_433671 [Caerostris extrusa]|uniref:Uncharacterized protein n=1 Tax=Caerostris extrusa TaxID=172846 RepID=A0AAV4TMA1_CAEEX|nr:hypothetical protein CEXT_433671 [Caerostris extrusa]
MKKSIIFENITFNRADLSTYRSTDISMIHYVLPVDVRKPNDRIATATHSSIIVAQNLHQAHELVQSQHEKSDHGTWG